MLLVLSVFCWSLVCLPGSPLDSAEETAAKASSHTTDEVACPDCDPKGRLSCPECRGKGSLIKECQHCSGKGRRPCRNCNKKGRGADPGHVPCSFCSGEGSVNDGERTCPKCAGEQSVVCTSCLGNGYHSCRKVAFDKICPRCRYVGTIVCPACDGRRRLSHAALERHKAEKRKLAVRTKKSAKATKKKKLTSLGKASDEKLEATPENWRELRKRFEALSEARETYDTIFLDDLRPEATRVANEASALHRRLKAVGDEDLSTLLSEFSGLQKRVVAFRARWAKIESLIRRDRRNFANCEACWQQRSQAERQLKSIHLDKRQKQLFDRLTVVLRIAQASANKVLEHAPETLMVDLREIKQLALELKSRSDLEMSLAAHRWAAKASQAEIGEKAKAADFVPVNFSTRSKSRDRASVQRPEHTESKSKATGASRDRSSLKKANLEVSSRKKRKKARNPLEKITNVAPPSAESTALPMLFAVCVGFVAACGLFAAIGYWRRLRK